MLHFNCITSETEIAQLREDWNRFLNHPNTDLDFYLSIVRSRDQVIAPFVVTIMNGDEILAIIAARLEKEEFVIRLGYRTIARPKLKMLRIVHGNSFEKLPADIQHALLDELLGTLKRNQAEILVFDSLQTGSAIDQAIKSRTSPLIRKAFIVSSPHWQIDVAENFEDYMLGLSRTTRKGLRRRCRKLEQKFSDSLSVKRVLQENDLETMLSDMESVSRKTYQSSIGKGVHNNAETRHTMLLALRAGRLSSLVAYIGDEPVAFDNAVRYGSTLYLENSGYDPAYSEDGLGTYLLLKQIEIAHEIDDLDCIDFGSGDSGYKVSLSNSSWDEYSTYVFAGGLKGILLNFLNLSIVGTHNACSNLLKRLGVFEKIRNATRKRINE